MTSNLQENTIKKARLVKRIVETHYEPGRQDRSQIQIWRNHVQKQYPMSERTFWRMMKIADSIVSLN